MGFIGSVPMGFSRTAEAGEILPPTDATYQAGSLWLQASGLNRNPMQLTRVTESFKGECTLYWFLNLTASPVRIVANDVKETAQFANGVLKTVGEAYKTAVVDMAQLGVTAVKKTGNVVANSAIKTGQFINATTDKAWDVTVNLTSDLPTENTAHWFHIQIYNEARRQFPPQCRTLQKCYQQYRPWLLDHAEGSGKCGAAGL